jgi:hypothetical protein
MSENLPDRRTQRVADFLKKVQSSRGRLIFAFDCTASRQPAWDSACELQAQMFHEASKIGAIEIQLVYYRGLDECGHSRWTTDARELAAFMERIHCLSGHTKIGRVLQHVRREHERQAVSAVVFIGDMMEETAHELYEAAVGLPPIFLFQEGDDALASTTFKKLAELTNGAHAKFAPGAARALAELLRAIAAFAVGGLTALADLRTDGARRLLGQLK